jgi:uncharacterized coiled-coil DUF342 family protein
MAQSAAKRTKRPARAKQPVRNLDEEVQRLQQEVSSLRERVSSLLEQLKWREDARDGYKASADRLSEENKRLLTQLNASHDARFEVSRLEGVLQGLERAGKIERAL